MHSVNKLLCVVLKNWRNKCVSMCICSFWYFIFSGQLFYNERIDGWSLSLLTESHLTGSLHLKLGPALKLRSVLDSRLKNSCCCRKSIGDSCYQDDNRLCKFNANDLSECINTSYGKIQSNQEEEIKKSSTCSDTQNNSNIGCCSPAHSNFPEEFSL